MAFAVSSTGSSNYRRTQTDYRAMSIATTLFFMWGFLTCMNDILIPHLKSIFSLSIAQSALIQTAFFGSYFVFALPAGKLVEYRGYKYTMVTGLGVAALGAVLFIPAARMASYPLFLGALVILAAGITALQV
ncbi:MAG: glucose/galactose MFS transporter, partial [Terriglobus sp.]